MKQFLRVLTLAAALIAIPAFTAVPAAAQSHGETTHAPAAPAAQPGHGAVDTHAAGGHAPTGSILPSAKEGLPVMIAAFLVFGLVVAILSVKVWPVILKGLEDRAAKIRAEIEAAEMAQQQAKAALAQYEKSLADAQAQAQQMLVQAKAQQQSLIADLKTKAEAETVAMRERARRDIEAAKRAALKEIYDEAAALATGIAGKLLQREITSADQQRLVQESLAELNHARA